MEPFSALLLSADRGPIAVIQKTLEEYGVNVKIVATAEAAEQLIKTTKFDLGVFDLDLPEAMNLAVPGANLKSASPRERVAESQM
jgi:CheY-like chemotaxis protein